MDLTRTSRTPWPSLHGASSVDRSVFYREKRASGRAALPPPSVYEGTRFLAYTFSPSSRAAEPRRASRTASSLGCYRSARRWCACRPHGCESATASPSCRSHFSTPCLSSSCPTAGGSPCSEPCLPSEWLICPSAVEPPTARHRPQCEFQGAERVGRHRRSREVERRAISTEGAAMGAVRGRACRAQRSKEPPKVTHLSTFKKAFRLLRKSCPPA